MRIDRSGLKVFRHDGRRFLGKSLAAGTTGYERSHAEAFTNTKPACPLRSKQALMPGKANNINLVFFHIDRKYTRSLRGIKQKIEAMTMADRTSRPNIDALIRATLGGEASELFDAIAAGDEVAARFASAPDGLRVVRSASGAWVPSVFDFRVDE